MGTNSTLDTSHDLPADRVREMVASGEAELIDVRQDFEWEAGHIADARHIELERLPAESGSIDRSRPAIFVCRSGSRSGMAAEAFRSSGYEAYNLEGGMLAWVERGLPIEPADGEVASGRPDAG